MGRYGTGGRGGGHLPRNFSNAEKEERDILVSEEKKQYYCYVRCSLCVSRELDYRTACMLEFLPLLNVEVIESGCVIVNRR